MLQLLRLERLIVIGNAGVFLWTVLKSSDDVANEPLSGLGLGVSD